MMGGPWRSVPDLLYETYSTGDLGRGYPSDPGFGNGCCHRSTTLPPASAYHHHHCGERAAPAPRQCDGLQPQPPCPSDAVCPQRYTPGTAPAFTVPGASVTRLANGDGNVCLACQRYHFRRPEPITRQPLKSSRPQYIKVTSDWSTNLYGCTEDEHTCLLGALCSPCLACSLARQLGESCCVVTCVPGGVFALRTKLRMQQNIQGSICDDCLTLSCCCPFALCQMARELDNAEIGRLG